MESQIIHNASAVAKKCYQKPGIEIVHLLSDKAVLGVSCQDVDNDGLYPLVQCNDENYNCKVGS